MKTFVGRQEELLQLKVLFSKKTASLVTIQGRRRIGKSTLVRKFCSLEKIPCYEFQGLPPRPKLSNQDQLNEFSKHLAKHLGIAKIGGTNWTQLFEQLDLLVMKATASKHKCVILLDEISWMGAKDADFSGYFKDVWDRVLSQNANLILILCGSVSSWIQKNILENTGFVGRISKEFHLKELSLAQSHLLLKSSLPSITTQETAQIVSLVGGVPKYLEEFSPYKSVSVGIRELCFKSTGFLFNELDFIFAETFGKRNILYLQDLKNLLGGPKSPSELAQQTDQPLNGDWTEKLADLELAGFIQRDFTWDLNGTSSKLSRVRICDNYAKFYLKYIHPRKARLLTFPLNINDSLDFLNWPTIFGLQFENLILNNLPTLCNLANIPNNEVIQIGSYFQSVTKIQSGVQIDCLVQCKKGQLHLFEFKSGESIGLATVKEVAHKSEEMRLPKGFSLRHYLVYLGNLSEELQESDFFDAKIPFEEFLR